MKSLQRIPYFIWYIIKLPFKDLFKVGKSIKINKATIQWLRRPKTVFYILVTLNYANFQYKLYGRLTTFLLFLLLLLALCSKVWISGDDIRDRRLKRAEKYNTTLKKQQKI